MLYKLHLPDSARHLEWVVCLQRQLLEGLCQHATRPEQICEAWVAQCTRASTPDADWLRRFCGWSTKGKTWLDLMGEIAGFTNDAKDAVLAALDNDLNFQQAFDGHPHNLIGLGNLKDTACAAIVKEFCERFYDLGFYYGYRAFNGTRHIEFKQGGYVADFRAQNADVAVCPFCDGYPAGMELDHFYPKCEVPLSGVPSTQLSAHLP